MLTLDSIVTSPVIAHEADVKCKEDEELLISLAHTVVHPGTVMIHLLDTSATQENIQ